MSTSVSIRSTATCRNRSATTLQYPLAGPNLRVGTTTARYEQILSVTLLYSHHIRVQVDAQNKFMGKSFEIRPTGVAHAELLLPESQEPSYPKAISKDKVIEHYSWKKVTTNISGFILGSPTIDHYGDMVVRDVLHSDEDEY